MSKKNFAIWVAIILGTFLSVTVGRHWLGMGGGSSFITAFGSLMVMGVGLGSFYLLKKK